MPAVLDIPDDELHALDVLNKGGVEYLVIGGLAMRFYGRDREVGDLDLLVGNSAENADRLCRAIWELIGCHPPYSAQDLRKPNKRVQLRRYGYELDILTSVDGLDFSVAYRHRETAVERGVAITVVSKEHLLVIKKLAAKNEKRSGKELCDIKFLGS